MKLFLKPCSRFLKILAQVLISPNAQKYRRFEVLTEVHTNITLS
jgi:hypothetical protein